MAALMIRGIDDRTAKMLKERAAKEGTSVNRIVIRLLRQSLGTEKKSRRVEYHDLDHLAGTWKKKDLDDFNRRTEWLERIDKELWE